MIPKMGVKECFLGSQQNRGRFALLTDVEHVVFSLVVKDHSKEHIADMLGVSPHTVRHHREHMMTKLGAHSVAELCTIASRTGMLE